MLKEIEIILNGQTQRVPSGLTLAELIDSLNISSGPVAVERNHSIVSQKDWTQVSVEPGDVLEVVHFVGGGER